MNIGRVLFLIFSISFVSADGDKFSCDEYKGKDLLEDCSLLKGLTLMSHRGTVVNETNCDVILPKLVFSKEPSIVYKSADPKKHYTVLVLDPDAKNHTAGNFFVHLIKQNIPGSSFLEGKISDGTDVMKYVGTGPQVGRGDHRYIFAAYEQKTSDLKLKAPATRERFNLKDWLKDLPMCGPVAGVRFRTRYEL